MSLECREHARPAPLLSMHRNNGEASQSGPHPPNSLRARTARLPLGGLLCLLMVACRDGNGGPAELRVTEQPAATTQLGVHTPWNFQLKVENASSAVTFTLLASPNGLSVDATGRLAWTPGTMDLGLTPVRLQVADEEQDLLLDFQLRVHRDVLMGTTYSPPGHTGNVTTQGGISYLSSTTHGRLVGYHTNWRDPGATQGEIPALVHSAFAAENQFGIEATLVLGWADGNGAPDLTSDSQPFNNSWTNQETRTEFLAMLTAVAATYQPKHLGIANELNVWWATRQSQFDDWLSMYQEAYDAIHQASPNTQVYATFQLEFLDGQALGWPHGPTWAVFDQMAAGGPLDLAGFTSYPYLTYATPTLIPLDHYSQITDHWGAGPVAFTEIGWLSAPSFPYPGGAADQAAYVDRFFALTDTLDLEIVQWLFLHDLDIQALFPPFVGIGLRDNSGGTIRSADAAWQAAVALHERND